jgi:hypothetical protein
MIVIRITDTIQDILATMALAIRTTEDTILITEEAGIAGTIHFGIMTDMGMDMDMDYMNGIITVMVITVTIPITHTITTPTIMAITDITGSITVIEQPMVAVVPMRQIHEEQKLRLPVPIEEVLPVVPAA